MSAFIVAQPPVTGVGLPGLVFHQCHYAVAHYDDRLFGQLGVAFADNLGRAVNKRKAEFLAGRYCAAKVLGAFGLDDFVVETGKNRAPVWPVLDNGVLLGSITHSNSIAMAVASDRSDLLGIGIDIENIISHKTMTDINGAILHGDEASLLIPVSSAAGVSVETVFSLIFSLKESFFKAAYPSTGYYFDFDAITVNTIDFGQRQFSFTLNQDLNQWLVKGLMFSGQFCFVNEQVLTLIALFKSV